jgi:hypothetical protein
MEPNFIRIGPPPVVARTHKVINTTVFLEYHLKVVARTHKNHASDTGGGWARLSDCCSYTQE